MTREERYHFECLKERIAEKQGAKGQPRPPAEWSGQEIEHFREDLQEAVQGTVSEKWIYTHLRSEGQEKLPRIDTLNLLCRYVGYRDWEEFKADHPFEEGREKGRSFGRRKRMVRAFSILFLLLVFGAIPFLRSGDGGSYRFCFVDMDTGETVEEAGLKVKFLKEGESPRTRELDSTACLDVPRKEKKLRMVVEAPYYRTDTVIRRIAREGKGQERIPLERDDYAMLIGAWSAQDPEDRAKRRRRLERMIADDARIFQVHGEEERGIAMYNKEEFIDKLTMPLRSLKRIWIIETAYDDEGRIRNIRFTQATEQNQGP